MLADKSPEGCPIALSSIELRRSLQCTETVHYNVNVDFRLQRTDERRHRRVDAASHGRAAL